MWAWERKFSLGFSILSIFLSIPNSGKHCFPPYFPPFVSIVPIIPPTKHSVNSKKQIQSCTSIPRFRTNFKGRQSFETQLRRYEHNIFLINFIILFSLLFVSISLIALPPPPPKKKKKKKKNLLDLMRQWRMGYYFTNYLLIWLTLMMRKWYLDF